MSGFNDFMGKASIFASKAAVKAKDLAGVAAAKTKQVSRIAKLNMDISGQKETIKKAYTELGKLYYETHHDAPDGPFAQACQEIDLAQAAIAAMEEELAGLKAAMSEEESCQEADFESVVDETAAEADVEVEIEVVEEPAQPAPQAADTPAEPAPDASQDPDFPETSDAPEEPVEPAIEE